MEGKRKIIPYINRNNEKYGRKLSKNLKRIKPKTSFSRKSLNKAKK